MFPVYQPREVVEWLVNRRLLTTSAPVTSESTTSEIRPDLTRLLAQKYPIGVFKIFI